MATLNKPVELSGQRLALVMILTSSLLSIVVFLLARYDHDMKLLALGNVLGQVTALMSTASTMLVGKDFSGHSQFPEISVPDGSKVDQTSTLAVQTPSASPEVTEGEK